MNADSEKKAAESAIRHAEAFRRKHGVSQRDWDLAEAMADDLGRELLNQFWEVYDREGNDRRRDSSLLPGTGLEVEVRPANVPAKEGTRARSRKTRNRAAKQRDV